MTVTFGRTSTALSYQTISDYLVGDYAMTQVKGRPLSISAYLQLTPDIFNTTFTWTFALYSYVAAGNPGSFVACTGVGTQVLAPGVSFTGWKTLNITTAGVFLRPMTNYFIVAWGDDDTPGGDIKIGYALTGSSHGFRKAEAYTGMWPISIVGETAQARLYSIYCTMTQDTRPGFRYVDWTP